jgi:hypothetical protein
VADRLCDDARELAALKASEPAPSWPDSIGLAVKLKRGSARWLRGLATRAEHAEAEARREAAQRAEAVEHARQGELWQK